MINFDKIDKLISLGYISKRKHPEYDIYILNYTPKTQYKFYWTEETIICRGLIVDKYDNILAQPFPKFFTLSQYETLNNLGIFSELFHVNFPDAFKHPVHISNKIDGSLIVGFFYTYANKFILSSRGSFVSDQAIEAEKIFIQRYYKKIPLIADLTYLFEVVYPENRIVVDYKNLRDIILLEVLDKKQKVLPILDFLEDGWTVVEEPRFASLYTDINVLKNTIPNNSEGYVVRYDNGMRLKVKSDEYLRLTKLISLFDNDKYILKCLADNNGLIDDLLSKIPDEFYKDIHNKVSVYKQKFNDILIEVTDVYSKCSHLTRKEIAMLYSGYKYRDMLFKQIDRQDLTQYIWESIIKEL